MRLHRPTSPLLPGWGPRWHPLESPRKPPSTAPRPVLPSPECLWLPMAGGAPSPLSSLPEQTCPGCTRSWAQGEASPRKVSSCWESRSLGPGNHCGSCSPASAGSAGAKGRAEEQGGPGQWGHLALWKVQRPTVGREGGGSGGAGGAEPLPERPPGLSRQPVTGQGKQSVPPGPILAGPPPQLSASTDPTCPEPAAATGQQRPHTHTPTRTHPTRSRTRRHPHAHTHTHAHTHAHARTHTGRTPGPSTATRQ